MQEFRAISAVYSLCTSVLHCTLKYVALEVREELIHSVGETGCCFSKDKDWGCTREGAGVGWR